MKFPKFNLSPTNDKSEKHQRPTAPIFQPPTNHDNTTHTDFHHAGQTARLSENTRHSSKSLNRFKHRLWRRFSADGRSRSASRPSNQSQDLSGISLSPYPPPYPPTPPAEPHDTNDVLRFDCDKSRPVITSPSVFTTASTTSTTGAVTSEVPPASYNGDEKTDTKKTVFPAVAVMSLTIPDIPTKPVPSMFDTGLDKTLRAEDRVPRPLAGTKQLNLPPNSPPTPLPESPDVSVTPSPRSQNKSNSIVERERGSRFSRRALQDKATQLRRMLREKIRTSTSASSITQDDMSEHEEEDEGDLTNMIKSESYKEHADETINQFMSDKKRRKQVQKQKECAAAQSDEHATKRKQRKNRNQHRSKHEVYAVEGNEDDDDEDEDEDEDNHNKESGYGYGYGNGNVPRMPAEIPQLYPCTDGSIDFVVPKGWTATRCMDSFILSNGRSLGYVRSVSVCKAIDALMETNRLQIMSEVHALSSPVFGESGEAFVNYFSHLGAGKGVAIFDDNNGGACVFALCGPTNEQDMIERGITDLMTSVKVLKRKDGANGTSCNGASRGGGGSGIDAMKSNRVSLDVIKDVRNGKHDTTTVVSSTGVTTFESLCVIQ